MTNANIHTNNLGIQPDYWQTCTCNASDAIAYTPVKNRLHLGSQAQGGQTFEWWYGLPPPPPLEPPRIYSLNCTSRPVHGWSLLWLITCSFFAQSWQQRRRQNDEHTAVTERRLHVDRVFTMKLRSFPTDCQYRQSHRYKYVTAAHNHTGSLQSLQRAASAAAVWLDAGGMRPLNTADEFSCIRLDSK